MKLKRRKNRKKQNHEPSGLPDAPPDDVSPDDGQNDRSASFDAALHQAGARSSTTPQIRAARVGDLASPTPVGQAPGVTHRRLSSGGVPPMPPKYQAKRRAPDRDPAHHDFWARYDQAQSELELFALPPAPIRAVVGPFEEIGPTIDQMTSAPWLRGIEPRVVALTKRPHRARPTWVVTSSAADMMQAAGRDHTDAVIFAIDMPFELEPWLGSLVRDLRGVGVGVVHYLLPGSATDEDLATWHGEIGRPAVLELTTEADPARIVSLVERGEPVMSVAGVPITAAFLVAVRREVC